MHHAFVVPRYGVDIVGGAESASRMLAERLVAQLGWSVDVFTTCARDHMTWADEYPAGDETINGVTVHRFSSSSGRPAEFFPYSERVLSAPAAATSAEAERFVDLQGPGCRLLSEAVADAGASSPDGLFAFYPYLYTTTVRTIASVARRALLHPAAHDEPALHLPIYRATVGHAAGLVFHTRSERDLVQKLFPVAERPQIVLGLGFEEAPDPPEGGRHPGEVTGLGERPYLLCLGRVDGFKGSTMLARLFAAYKERRPGPLALVLAGPVTAQPPAHPDVVVTGPLDEADKWSLLRGARILVNPSPHESFSLVVLEAFSTGRPVLVNARCAPTREHCERSGGGLWFGSYAQFEVAVDRLASDAWLRQTMGEHGRRYVEANFRWPTIIERYGRFVHQVAERSAQRMG